VVLLEGHKAREAQHVRSPKMQGYHGKSGSYVWPQTLRLPPRPLKLVYLDLNHWVALAKAMAGHSDGEASAVFSLAA